MLLFVFAAQVVVLLGAQVAGVKRREGSSPSGPGVVAESVRNGRGPQHGRGQQQQEAAATAAALPQQPLAAAAAILPRLVTMVLRQLAASPRGHGVAGGNVSGGNALHAGRQKQKQLRVVQSRGRGLTVPRETAAGA